MGTHSQQVTQGFTIVETMLVLAITGVLIAGLLVGLGSSISNQRYLDAVSSFKTVLQDQYSQINNVTNDRDAGWTCNSSATPVVTQNGGTAPGQSDCVLLGRYLGIVGDKITMATVVGYPHSDTSSSGTIASIKTDYTLGISTSSIEQVNLEWGAQIAWPTSGGGARSPTTPRSLAILMIRSPENGTSYTFTGDTVNQIDSVSSAVLLAMMAPDLNATNPGQGARTVCLDPAGFNVPEKLAVYIGAGASGPGSIEVRSKALTAAAGGDTQC
ncbi:MAG TPA: type II secretion system protein [Candidatus Microsaccharimonas sp.]|jgi:type II secretory pathway pseudopilin PulG